MKTQLTKALVLVSFAGSFVVAGCELIVDFDRTKIPVESADTGVADSSVDLGDSSFTQPAVDAGEDADADAQAPESHPDAGDAGSDADADAG